MGGRSKKQTVGYKYYLGMHMILCHGPVDRLLRIRVDEKTAWQGDQQGSGSINVAAENLFGGESREGGVSGTVDFEVGGPTQGKNSYLASKVESNVPNFRGVVGAILRQVYLGLNPYLKKWDFRISRVHVRQNGLAQWYDAKAELRYGASFQFPASSSGWKYKVVELNDSNNYASPEFDDSSWQIGTAPFATQTLTLIPPAPFSPVPNTIIPTMKKVWLRRKFNFETSYNVKCEIESYVDDHYEVYINGVMIGSGGSTNPAGDVNLFHFRDAIPNGLLRNGENTIALLGINKVGVPPTYTSPGYADCRLNLVGLPQYDMNPAHIIRECLTDPDWGMGYAETDIDDTSFRAAADALFDEGMGISILWDRQMPIEDFIKEILKHIDAVLYIDRTTGKFVLRLIRGDYNAEDLLLLNEDNIIKLDGFQRTAFGELTNSVTVNYWDSETGNTASLTVQDIALAQMQGAVINTTVQYPGFTNSVIASRVAQRDLKTLSTPLITCTIYANQDAKDLNIGDVFLLSWDDYELDPTPMRVNSIAYGDGKKNQIKITAVQDVFALPTTAVVSPSPLPPVQSITPVPVSTRQVFEVPYLELVQVRGQTEIDNILAADPLAGFVGAAAIRPLSGAINARMLVDAGAGYEEIGALEFAPGAKLASSIGRTETTLPIQDGVDLDQVVLGTWLQCDSEIMAVTALSDTSITVKRGCLDTVPAPHAAGAALVFWDNYSQGDERQYASGETVKVKLQTVTGEGELPAEQAPEDAVTMSARAARPYPPGAVRINSQWFPEVIRGTEALSLSWAHRDRKQQTGQNLIGFTDGSIGPEPGTTYTLRLYGETGSLLRTETGLTGTSYTWTAEEADSGLTIPGSAAADYVAEVMADSPSAYWRVSSGGLVDIVGSADIPTLPSGVSVSDGILPSVAGQSLTFTGANAIAIPAGSWAPTGNSDRSMELWFSTTIAPATGSSSKAFPGLLGYGTTGTTRRSFFFRPAGAVEATPADRAYVVWTWGDDLYVTGSVDWNTGAPLHAMVTYKGSTRNLRLYLNGLLVGQKTLGANLDTPAGTTFLIGGNAVGVPWQGKLQEIAMYSTEVSAARVLAHYDAGIAATNRLNGRIRAELESVRGGLVSHQKHNITVDRAGWGYNWGNYWGGI